MNGRELQRLKAWVAPRAWWSASSPWIVLGLGALVLPTAWRLGSWVWASDDQGHGPIVLAVGLLLLLRAWPAVVRGRPEQGATALAMAMLALSLLVYALGRSQAILILEVGSLILLAGALILLLHGWSGLRAAGFALFFLLFMIPLPEALVATVTAPLKSAVSLVAASILQAAGLPVARAGVMITAGPYQLLVADACAGLNTLFTLEAMGLLYLHLLGRVAWWRQLALALLIVPIGFAANVLRVVTLTLVTLWWGDAAGQGFAHGFAGMTLFLAALLLILLVDGALVGIGRLLQARDTPRAQLGT